MDEFGSLIMMIFLFCVSLFAFTIQIEIIDKQLFEEKVIE